MNKIAPFDEKYYKILKDSPLNDIVGTQPMSIEELKLSLNNKINESNKLLKTDIPAEQKENLKAYISWVGSILNDVNTKGGIFDYVYGK